jgi:hypothetical protein
MFPPRLPRMSITYTWKSSSVSTIETSVCSVCSAYQALVYVVYVVLTRPSRSNTG